MGVTQQPLRPFLPVVILSTEVQRKALDQVMGHSDLDLSPGSNLSVLLSASALSSVNGRYWGYGDVESLSPGVSCNHY